MASRRAHEGVRRQVGMALVLVLLCAIGWGEGVARAGAFEEGLDFFAAGHYRWALERFLQAVDQAPNDPQRRWHLAETYQRLGETGAAAHEYRLILQVAPHAPLAASARRTLAALGEPALARVEIPFGKAGTRILLPGKVNGQDVGAFILDTGATFMSINGAAAARLGVSGTGATVHLVTASGRIEAPLGLLEEVEIGGAVARHVPAVIHDLPHVSSSIAGLLGLSFLERFRVNIDLGAGLLILESGN